MIAASNASGSRHIVSASMSTNTGTAFAATIAVALAVKESGDVITSAPSVTPIARSADVSADVAEFIAIAKGERCASAHTASKRRTFGPPRNE